MFVFILLQPACRLWLAAAGLLRHRAPGTCCWVDADVGINCSIERLSTMQQLGHTKTLTSAMGYIILGTRIVLPSLHPA